VDIAESSDNDRSLANGVFSSDPWSRESFLNSVGAIACVLESSEGGDPV